jgi:uncharacterized membrane protein (DUF441 family)
LYRRTATRGKDSRFASERIFPEIAFSTYAVIAACVNWMEKSRNQDNQTRSRLVVNFLIQQYLKVGMQIPVNVGVDVAIVAGRDIHRLDNHAVCLIPVVAGGVDVRQLLGHAQFDNVARRLASSASGVALADLLVATLQAKEFGLLGQLIHSLATAIEVVRSKCKLGELRVGFVCVCV